MHLTTVRDIPVFSFFKRMLDPVVILGTLFVLTRVQHEPFSGHYLVLAIIAFFVSSYLHEQIDSHRNWRIGSLRALARGIFFGWAIFVAIIVLIGYATGYSYLYSERVIWTWFGATPFILLAGHLALRRFAFGLHSAGQTRTVVIVGLNQTGLTLAKRIAESPHRMMEVRGFFDDRAEERLAEQMSQAPFLGKMADAAVYVREQGINMIFISQSMSAQPRGRQLLDELQDTTASIYFLPDLVTFDLMQARFDEVGGMPVVAICETPFSGLNSLVKRASDIVLASISLLMLAPVMLSIAAAVKFTSKGPVIFRQRRYGLNGEEIVVYKFRSMSVAEDGARVTQARKGDQRVTRLGAVLRRTSLDELPQFLNVLGGSMSIVGPRPHAVAHNEQYRGLIKGYMLRHKVKPGITGWAQVNGLRGETDTLDKMAARIEFDLDYLRNWSLSLDLWIVLRTVKVVLGRDNAY
ncbi:putative colanic acid biosysnthesis UDP-glucose lipid carrier transferase [Massilia sp. CF038]|nr:putative colanic acid biosysnthesis UDP-glucose lipid carrier transferase [Massilia sp. CF038]